MPEIIILAIESSCDDTSAAICVDGKVVSNLTANQHVHEQFGGVIPELASREHTKNIIPVVAEAIKQAGISKNQIHAVAFTRGPGLLGSLLVGGIFAKSFAQAMQVPLIDVHHMQAHVLAHFIDAPMPAFPFLCLTVSGGHTQIVLVNDYLDMKVIGTTIDDAAGEAFDKTAKMLNLPYPGGPLIDKYAQLGNSAAFKFTEPQIEGFNFSFSGLKTNILYFLQKELKQNPNFIDENLNDICASVQHTIVSILIKKLLKASKETTINEIAIAGGVSANLGLRNALTETGKKNNWKTYIPQFQYCTDNAGMISIAAYHKYLRNEFCPIDIPIKARLEF
ncbi:MAG TPA: tRNA (adenosine(37)-N6)-threonylcarbamoyltransferase complex transferase subunit TsaD [Chitinophagales bacterium]|jgi:N6-L-threonylcarbamoyladenine synthase|nr:tRNA (adenosine(37)-N6)-threonylcarbamoyltransferase complex transferase subunit TsaD [Chitinophagales bacterium]HQW79951.1 tRNA (adenosine(37)-N6)-threonylcarbamoyltransferase complex transferase subunit TsaD [Chitinophagales bacterium]